MEGIVNFVSVSELTISSKRQSPGQVPGQIPGDRLKQFSKVWDQMRALPEWLNIIRHGYSFKFQGRGPKLMKVDMKWATELAPSKMKVIREEVKDLIQKGAMRKVLMVEAKVNKGFYSKMLCAEAGWKMETNN